MKIKKPFDLEKAKNGAEVVTREGLVYNFLHILQNPNTSHTMMGYTMDSNGNEIGLQHMSDGHYNVIGDSPHRLDLFILEEPKQVWTNVYRLLDSSSELFVSGNFSSEKEASESVNQYRFWQYIKTMLLHEE